MLVRQLPAATSRSAAVISTCMSFSAAANTATSISGPTAGAVPNAGGVPEGAALGAAFCFGGLPLGSALSVAVLPAAAVEPATAAELAMAAEPAMAAEVNRNSRRDFDMLVPHQGTTDVGHLTRDGGHRRRWAPGWKSWNLPLSLGQLRVGNDCQTAMTGRIH